MNSSEHYKYVHIDSRHRNKRQSKSNFTVQIPHGLDNISKVCVKSFSIPNSFGNMYGNLDRLYWIEYYNNGVSESLWKQKVFYIKLADLKEKNDYSDNLQLVSYLNSQLSQTVSAQYPNADIFDADTDEVSNHKFAEEFALKIHIAYDETTFKFKLSTSNSIRRKLFAPFVTDYTGSLWENMGFDLKNIVANDWEMDLILNELNDKIKTNFDNLNTSDLFKRYKIIDAAAVVPLAHKSIESDFVASHENHIQRLYICSDTLVSDSLVVKENLALATNILDEVVNDVAKFSYIHKEITGTPMWNRILNPNIKSFDIKLFDDKNTIIANDEMPDFHLTLMFEVKDEVEYNAVDIEKYMQAAFKLGHRIK